jgi:hypothetical protein
MALYNVYGDHTTRSSIRIIIKSLRRNIRRLELKQDNSPSEQAVLQYRIQLLKEALLRRDELPRERTGNGTNITR